MQKQKKGEGILRTRHSKNNLLRLYCVPFKGRLRRDKSSFYLFAPCIPYPLQGKRYNEGPSKREGCEGIRAACAAIIFCCARDTTCSYLFKGRDTTSLIFCKGRLRRDKSMYPFCAAIIFCKGYAQGIQRVFLQRIQRFSFFLRGYAW